MSPTLPCPSPTAAAILLLLAATPTTLPGQQGGTAPRWTFRTSALLTGSSDTSVEGYKVLSGFGLGAGVRRQITGILSAEFNLAVASREVVIEDGSGGEAEEDGVRITTITINPFTISAGVGFRF